jgi:hypothetical protein
MSGNAQGASLRSTLTALIQALQQATDAGLRKDERGISCVAPHRFRVLLDYNIYSQFNPQALRTLQEELTTSAGEYINDRRYKLSQPIELTLTYDAITPSTSVRADFGPEEPTQLPEKSPEKSPEKLPAKLSARPEEQIKVAPVNKLYRLKSVSGPVKISVDLKNFKPGGSPVTIGRGQDNVVILDDQSVSKFHATMAFSSDGKIILADCGSTNGTFLNEKAVSGRVEVAQNDVIGVGDVRLRLEKAE